MTFTDTPIVRQSLERVFERRAVPEPACLGSTGNGEAGFPVVQIPPLRGGDFQGVAGLSSDDSLAVGYKQRANSKLQ